MVELRKKMKGQLTHNYSLSAAVSSLDGSSNTTPKWMLRFAVTLSLRAPEAGEYVDTV